LAFAKKFSLRSSRSFVIYFFISWVTVTARALTVTAFFFIIEASDACYPSLSNIINHLSGPIFMIRLCLGLGFLGVFWMGISQFKRKWGGLSLRD